MKISFWTAGFLFLALSCGSWAEETNLPADGTIRKKTKERPPRVPDAPFVPKRGMMSREKNQFWVGPADEGRFVQILSLTLIPADQLKSKLEDWPMYQKFSEEQKVRLIERIDEVRVSSRKQALEVAKDFDLAVTPENADEFVQNYWRERVAMEQNLQSELLTKRKKLEEDAKRRLEQRYKTDSK